MHQPPFPQRKLAVMVSFVCQFWHYPDVLYSVRFEGKEK